MNLRKSVTWLAGGGVLAVVLLGAAALRLGGQSTLGARRGGAIPTARVQRGNFELRVHGTGEVRPTSVAQLIVPPVGGTTLQIVHLLSTGTRVKEGDLVVEFDPSEQEYNLEQARSRLLEAEQEITKAKADAIVRAAEDKVALLKARFDVRRAELEVNRNELVSAIDAKKNLLNLEEAGRRLEQLEQDVKSREASNQAALAVLEEKRNKAQLETGVAERNIQNMQLRAPMAGLVSVKENFEGVRIFGPGITVPEYKLGDLTSSGRTIAEILNVDQMEVVMRIAESERSNLQPGQNVQMLLDAMPGRTYTGKVRTVGGAAARGFFFGPSGPTRNFEVVIDVSRPDEQMRPGVTARVTVLGDQVPDALFLPRQAVFEKDGKPVVYVRGGAGFVAREVQIKHRTESRVVIEGLTEGTEAALSNPEGSSQPAKAPPPQAGPRITGGAR
jgi:RND family efflux transporter MFP subunit